jgi:hypothetical protein
VPISRWLSLISQCLMITAGCHSDSALPRRCTERNNDGKPGKRSPRLLCTSLRRWANQAVRLCFRHPSWLDYPRGVAIRPLGEMAFRHLQQLMERRVGGKVSVGQNGPPFYIRVSCASASGRGQAGVARLSQTHPNAGCRTRPLAIKRNAAKDSRIAILSLGQA